jgi:hypothetical protein
MDHRDRQAAMGIGDYGYWAEHQADLARYREARDLRERFTPVEPTKKTAERASTAANSGHPTETMPEGTP